MLAEHYAGIRRWAPTFLDAFVFQGVPAAAALMRAIDMLLRIPTMSPADSEMISPGDTK